MAGEHHRSATQAPQSGHLRDVLQGCSLESRPPLQAAVCVTSHDLTLQPVYQPLRCLTGSIAVTVSVMASECTVAAADEALRSEGRLVLTDHSDFVIANIYAPNSGDRPERARLPFKLAWYAALQEELASWAGRGRRVVLVGDFNIPRESRDVHPGMEWKGLYSDEVRRLFPGWVVPVSGLK